MFDAKKKELYVSSVEDNIFTRESKKEYTTSGNGALKVSTTGNVFVDDFGNIARYKEPRDIKDVFQTMNELWSVDPITTLKESVYIRLITRNPVLFSGKKLDVQRGQGLRAEYFSRMMWLAVNHPFTFKKNLDILIAVGSWKDVFDLMRLDLSYEHHGSQHALDWAFLTQFLMNGLSDEKQANLIKKYLPQIKTARLCTTLRNQQNNYIAKYLANKLFIGGNRQERYKSYRKLKSSGTAHEWQKLISQHKFDKINFDAIAGRALALLSSSKFLENHHLEDKFYEWIMKQPTAKFTGFPYELFKDSTAKKYQKEVVNKQFLGLIETAKQNMNQNSNFIVCVDSSGSMESMAKGTNVSALHVAKSMALYFSYLLKGKFAKTFLEFNSQVTVKNWVGNKPYDNFFNTRLSGYCGSTNFLGVAKTLVSLRDKGYEESEFPTGVICISDGEFDSGTTYGLSWNESMSNKVKLTTFEEFKAILRNAFSPEFVDNFKLVLWDVPNGFYGREKSVFESFAEAPNFFYMSGFDPSGIAFLTGKEIKEKPIPKNALELFQAAMDQEILGMLRI